MPATPSDSSALPPKAFPAQPEPTGLSAAYFQDGVTASGRPRPRFFNSLLDYLRSLVAISRWQLFSAIVLMTLASLSEGFGVAMLFPILEVSGLSMTNEGHVGHYTAEVRHLLLRSGLPQPLWLPILLMVFLMLVALRSLFNRAQSVGTLATVLKFEMALSQRLYQSIVNAEWLFLVRSRASNFTHALTAELSRVATATHLFIGALSSGILALVYIALAFKLSAGTTLMVLIAGALLTWASRGWLRAVHESGSALSETVSAVYSAATEHLQNLKTIKTYDAQAADLAVFRALEASALEQNLRNTGNQAAAAFWFEAGSLAVLGGVIFVSLLMLHVGAASLLLLLAIFTRLMPRLAAANSQIQAFLGDFPAFENVQRISRECGEHAEAREQSVAAPTLAREFRLEEVSFAYGPQLPMVLDQLSITLAAGKITAIVGPSGAGKSTIADLINGLLTPVNGRILVDGDELSLQSARAWRRRVGYVAQDTVLFYGSIRANLLWAQPNASDGDLKDALALAAAEFAFELPHGLETVIGDRGMLLSNGQRQRIALARALLRKPSLLILDEATNSLDLENEQRILDTIDRLQERTTILIVSHRASAVQRAEMIYVVEHGRVVDCGDWASLSRRSPADAGLLFRMEKSPRR